MVRERQGDREREREKEREKETGRKRERKGGARNDTIERLNQFITQVMLTSANREEDCVLKEVKQWSCSYGLAIGSCVFPILLLFCQFLLLQLLKQHTQNSRVTDTHRFGMSLCALSLFTTIQGVYSGSQRKEGKSM